MASFSMTLAIGIPALIAETPITVSGFKPQIDGQAWRIVKVGHSVGDGGFTTRVEMERAV